MARHHHRRTRRGRFPQRGIQVVAAGGVETGVWLVEQPQLGAPGHQARQRGTTALTCTEARHLHRRQAARQPEPVERGGNLGLRRTHRGTPETDVVGHREVGVQAIRMAEQTHARAHGIAIEHKIVAEHRGRAALDGQQPGAHTQQ